MVTRAMYDGQNVVITFNEPIQLDAEFERNPYATDVMNEFGTGLRIEGAGSMVNYADAPEKWSLDATKTILTIEASAFDHLNAGDFSASHEYDESSLYADAPYNLESGEYKHGILHYPYVQDAKGNYWNGWAQKDRDTGYDDVNETDVEYADMARHAETFAMVSAIQDFTVLTENVNYTVTEESDVPNNIEWKFSHPVVTGPTKYFTDCDQTYTETDNASKLDQLFMVRGDGTRVLPITAYDDVTVNLNAACDRITLQFTTDGADIESNDLLDANDSIVFDSDIDDEANPLGLGSVLASE